AGPRADGGADEPGGGDAAHDDAGGEQARDLSVGVLGRPGDERRAPARGDGVTAFAQQLGELLGAGGGALGVLLTKLAPLQ
ncbi:MAG TPA: hypothetical protein VK576_04250, partial [Thermoleophilia bacterium]|nr:hypothetical protein [Thermoleophilia bacterium]